MKSEINFYTNFKEETFDDNTCFLCGRECEIKTTEHIFPKWLQHKYDLWDKRLIVTNDTTIPYRNLTVPCCEKCNNEDLSKVEEKFQALLERSFKNLTFEDEQIIFQWSAKILYATRYKELSLLVDRKNPELGNILTPYELESYSALHLFLQSIRFKTTFHEPKPWSIFVFNCTDDDFFYHNNIVGLCFSMKFGKIAFTIVFEDNNVIEDFMFGLKKLKEYPINFPQYLEINAHLFYSAIIKENAPKYYTTYNDNSKEINVNTVGVLRSRKWNDKEYAYLLDQILTSCGIDIGHSTWNPDGTITSFLIDQNGEHLTRKLFEK
ncbi:hypothetical protein EV195_1253 [Tenacibaculum skagerrakense]|uniref:HNH endonuclease n=1 Tax=Tenacibaculum skagerrakense TaxID=186571 RepID=A0A4R2NHV4_9FLAO|nr:hypothetical protein [Tenacibaculum skagerrakense]TCP21049.1 hypothetical protein EV195_1253 [Tenacibaculum skagerrakense]